MDRAVKQPEIEVTPEMIEAGADAFEWDERYEPLETAIERAYRAMMAVGPCAPSK